MANTIATTSRQLLSPANADLTDLVRQAREAHADVRNAFTNGLAHAVRAGQALNAAKVLVKDGWLNWLPRECGLSERTAQLYMQLARAIEDDPQRVAAWVGLSLREAVKRLTPATVKITTNVRNGARTAKPNRGATTGFDITQAWNAASPAQRKRAISNIGLKPLLEVIPESWIPALEKWLIERRKPIAPPAATPLVGNDPGPLPDFLPRVPETTH